MKDLPIYKMVLSDDPEITGVEYMALVDRPAMGVDFVKFAEATRFKTQDEVKQVVSGPIMIPDQLIYRFDEKKGEYYLTADRAVIEKTVLRFSKLGNFAKVNIQHDENNIVDDVFMFESFIIDRSKGILPTEFSDLPDGTWFGSYKIDNEQVWKDYISTGRLKGFSLEGYYGHELKTEPVKLCWIDEFLSDTEKVIREI